MPVRVRPGNTIYTMSFTSSKIPYNDFFLTAEKKNNNAGFSGLVGVYGQYNVLSEAKTVVSLRRVLTMIRHHVAVGGILLVLVRDKSRRRLMAQALKDTTRVIVAPEWHFGTISNNSTYLTLLNRTGYKVLPKEVSILALVYAPAHSTNRMVQEFISKGVPIISLVSAPVQT